MGIGRGGGRSIYDVGFVLWCVCGVVMIVVPRKYDYELGR